MIVKTVQFRKELKELLQRAMEEELFLDYYGHIFEIKPLTKTQTSPQTKRIIGKFSKKKAPKLRKNSKTDDLFDERDSAKEKKLLREARYGAF